MTKEWKEGFSEGYNKGFNEGYEKGKREHQQVNNPYGGINPNPFWPNSNENRCSVCGMSFVDELGRLKTMGYVCHNPQCPSKIMCSVGATTGTIPPGTTLLYKDPT